MCDYTGEYCRINQKSRQDATAQFLLPNTVQSKEVDYTESLSSRPHLALAEGNGTANPKVARPAFLSVKVCYSLLFQTVLVLVCVCSLLVPLHAEEQKELSAEQLFRAAAPAVVKITMENEEFDVIGHGSGFLIDHESLRTTNTNESVVKDKFGLAKTIERFSRDGKPVTLGFVCTNYHVIKPALSAEVKLSDGVHGRASAVLAFSPVSDLAILTVHFETSKSLPSLQLSQQIPAVGSKVYAIGSPKGLDQSLSQGIVSKVREGADESKWIQTTAAISQGSSGGPLFSSDGLVIGLTTKYVIGGQNLNFATSSSNLLGLLNNDFQPKRLSDGKSWRKIKDDAYSDYEYWLVRHLAKIFPKEDRNIRKRYFYGKNRPEEAIWIAKNICLEEKQYDEAISLLTNPGEGLPVRFEYLKYFTLGQAHYGRGLYKMKQTKVANTMTSNEDFIEKPLLNFKKSSRANPDFAPSYFWIAYLSGLDQDNLTSLKAADRLVELVPLCSSAYEQRGRFRSIMGLKDAAKADLETAVELDPLNYAAHYSLAGAYAKLLRHEDAIRTYEIASRDGNHAFKSNLAIAEEYSKMGQFEKALSFLEKTENPGEGIFQEWKDGLRKRIMARKSGR